MEKPDTINIPAYQRKRSLAAKSRKKTPAKTRRTKRTIAEPFKELSFNRPSLPSQSLFEEEASTTQPISGIREMALCGQCSGYFEKIDVAVIRLTSPLRVGDRIVFKKEKGLFEQSVDSIQIDNQAVSIAHSGKEIGLKVAMEPTVGTVVYKVIE